MSHMFGYYDSSFRDSVTSSQASSAASEARSAGRNVEYLEERVERLSLVCMAMWSLIQDKTDLTEKDLLNRVEQLDLMDGEADGKAAAFRWGGRRVSCERVAAAPLHPVHVDRQRRAAGGGLGGGSAPVRGARHTVGRSDQSR